MHQVAGGSYRRPGPKGGPPPGGEPGGSPTLAAVEPLRAEVFPSQAEPGRAANPALPGIESAEKGPDEASGGEAARVGVLVTPLHQAALSATANPTSGGAEAPEASCRASLLEKGSGTQVVGGRLGAREGVSLPSGGALPSSSAQAGAGGGGGALPAGRAPMSGAAAPDEPPMAPLGGGAGALTLGPAGLVYAAAGASRRPLPSPALPEGKRHRGPDPIVAMSPLVRAQQHMVRQFGDRWKGIFHQSHRLSLAAPLVFCRRCGHHGASAQHVVKLKLECLASEDSLKRLKSISQGRHPTNGSRIAEAVPLPLGERTTPVGGPSPGKP